MSAINLYTTKAEALYFKDSQRNSFYEFGGIQLLPNNTYTQKTTIALENPYVVSVLKVADDSLIGNLLYSITEIINMNTIRIDNSTIKIDNTAPLTIDVYATTPYYWSITPTVDYYNDLIYLKFTYNSTSYYTNPFYITSLDEDRTTKFTYKDLASNNYESIGLKAWFRQKSRQSELTTYYESSTKNTVTQNIKTHNLEMYESEFMSIEDLIMTAEILENPYLYIEDTRYSLFEAVKIPELTQQENFGKIKFTLAPNKKISINAFDDNASINGYVGGVAISNILSNDILNKIPILSSQVNIATLSSSSPNITRTGSSISIAPKTPSGNYSLVYKISEVGNSINYDEATINIVVSAAVILANNKTGTTINYYTGGTAFTNVLNGDTLNGVAVIPSEVSISFVSSTNAGITLSGTNVLVAANTPIGNHSLTYKISEILNPTNFDTGIISFAVQQIDLTIGQSALGGTVAYILQSGDTGYDQNIQHGFIITPSDISTSAQWGCSGTTISGAAGYLIGTGNQNTNDIINGCSTAGTAARLCYNLIQGGYEDWYLPSRDELLALNGYKSPLGLANKIYWSSTQVSGLNANIYDFNGSGSGGSYPKNSSLYVRAIRSF